MFVKEDEILLTGDNWLLTTDIDDQVVTIDTELRTFMEPEFGKNLDSLVSKEINFQRKDVSKLKTKLNKNKNHVQDLRNSHYYKKIYISSSFSLIGILICVLICCIIYKKQILHDRLSA